jgi:hypothetical protein
MKNWPQTILSQYSDSPRLLALLQSLDEWIGPEADFERFYRFIWDIREEGGAFGYGLDVWGRIVGVSRTLTVITGTYFGFQEAEDRTGFNQATFWDNAPGRAIFTLTDQTYRHLIFAKAAYNLTDSSIPAINAIMMHLFPDRGNAYVDDGRNVGHLGYFGFGEAEDRVGFGQGPFMDRRRRLKSGMNMTYVFDFALTPLEIAIVKVSGVLPKPVGVKAKSRYWT